MPVKLTTLNKGERYYNPKSLSEIWVAEETENFLIRGSHGFELLFKCRKARDEAMKAIMEDIGGIYEPVLPEPVVVTNAPAPAPVIERPKYGVIYPEPVIESPRDKGALSVSPPVNLEPEIEVAEPEIAPEPTKEKKKGKK